MVINKFSHIIVNDSSIIYFMVFGQLLNIPLEKITYWLVAYCAHWSVSNSFKCNIRSSAKYHKINCTGIGGNNMAKSIYLHTFRNMFEAHQCFSFISQQIASVHWCSKFNDKPMWMFQFSGLNFHWISWKRWTIIFCIS